MGAPLHVVSTEIIKPSSKTPHHLKKLKLSFLDQLAPSCYVSLVFFYQADESKDLTSTKRAQICSRLKQSLSSTLTSFYPFAGRMQDSSTVDCNDTGVEFIEARAHARLTDVIQGPDSEHLKQYLAANALVGESSLVVAKLTYFDCGGIAVGVSVSHKIADCRSTMAFVNAWAATCRGEAESSQKYFSFNLASYFPAREFCSLDWPPINSSKEKLVSWRFAFNSEKLAALRHVVASSSGSVVKDPTRVELVSAFIWKSFMEVAKLNDSGAKKDFAASHAVNLRGRTSPPHLLENALGNCVMRVAATAQHDEGGENFHGLVGKFRSVFRSIDHDYITKGRSGDGYVNDILGAVARFTKGEWELCSFSSWCRFPVYQVDYGWGSPICFFTSFASFKNMTILLNSRSGDGVEALVTMPQEVIERLETQIKIL